MGRAGSGSLTDSGDTPIVPDECDVCSRVVLPGNKVAEFVLEFAEAEDLGSTEIIARMRVLDFAGTVQVQTIVESVGSTRPERRAIRLSQQDEWQSFGIDMSTVRDVQFSDAGVGDAGFDASIARIPVNQFDKRRVLRVALRAASEVPLGVFTPVTIELDSFSFSDHPELDVDFSSATMDFTTFTKD